MITIVMYHYVRDLKRSRFPEIKGLDLGKFRQQLAHLKSDYEVVAAEEVVAAFESGTPLPENAALLTFDDGLIDHYTNVFPLLDEAGIQGCFYPPAQPIVEHIVLDVHKIQFMLAAVADKQIIVRKLLEELDKAREHWTTIPSNAELLAIYAVPWRFDTGEVMFIKKVLQLGLPLDLRTELTNTLFTHFVTTDESAFACELYVSVDQLRTMSRNGMCVGLHGYSHQWMSRLDTPAMANELDKSVAFLTSVGMPKTKWTFAYPFGDSSAELRSASRSRGCSLAFTTKIARAGVEGDALSLPRLDTNHLPPDAMPVPVS